MQTTELNHNDDAEYKFTAEDMKMLDERRRKRMSGESRTYTWNEAKEIITGNNPKAIVFKH